MKNTYFADITLSYRIADHNLNLYLSLNLKPLTHSEMPTQDVTFDVAVLSKWNSKYVLLRHVTSIV